jgi:hypothetical protein
MTFVMIGTAFVYVAFSRSTNVFYEYLLIGNDTPGAAFKFGLFYEVSSALFYYSFFDTLVGRYWLLYFDLKLAEHSSDQQWLSLLRSHTVDSSVDTTKHQVDDQSSWTGEEVWFYKHRLTYGNPTVVARIIVVGWAFDVLSVFAVYMTNPQRISLLHFTLALVVAGVVVNCSLKMPHDHDNIRLFEEHVMMLKLGTPFILVYACFIVVSLIIKQTFLVTCLRQAVNAIGMCVALLVMTVLIPRRFPANRRSKPLLSSSASTDSSKKKKGQLVEVLADMDTFRAFMKHLFTEFSYENLLCSVELMQFRKERKMALTDDDLAETLGGDDCDESLSDEEDCDDDDVEEKGDGDEEDAPKKKRSPEFGFVIAAQMAHSRNVSSFGDSASVCHKLKFPSEIMSMTDTISADGTLTFNARFLKIFDKYISNSAMMSVNISYTCRDRLRKIADRLRGNEEMLRKSNIDHRVFDNALTEIFHVMKDSYQRCGDLSAGKSILAVKAV